MTNYAKDHVPDWSRRPDPNKINTLIGFIAAASEPITKKNFRRWLVELAFDADPTAACSNGHDHGCNRGLGEWLGIEPYGQGTDGSVPWNQQAGYSSERLNRYVDPMWMDVVIKASFPTQKQMYIDLLTTLRDTGEYIYDWASYNFGQDKPTIADSVNSAAAA
jgi:hypothetical protein